MQRYVGVTGFTERGQVERALAAVPPGGERRLMVGVLASAKSLRGQPLKPEWRMRYPAPGNIPGIFPADRRALNLVHYAPGEEYRASIIHDLINLAENSGPLLDGFQINATWPEESALGVYREDRAYRQDVIVLQLGRAAIDAMDGWPTAVGKRVAMYGALIDGVLLDGSGGRGVLFDPSIVRPFLAEIAARCPTLGLGIAGGLDADGLSRLEPLLEEFPQLSVDAEGRLRTPDGGLDEAAVESYLAVAYGMLG